MEWALVGKILIIVNFLIVYLFIFTEKVVDRITAVLFGIAVSLVVGKFFHLFSGEDIAKHIDWATLILLFSMMIIVNVLEQTKLFEYMAVKLVKKFGRHPVKLLMAFSAAIALLSTVFANVTAVIVISGVTLVACKLLRVSPVPFLVLEALFSNVSGIATMIGDPPNMIIASAAGFDFNEFIFKIAPAVFIMVVLQLIVVYFVFKDKFPEVEQSRIDKLSEMRFAASIARNIWRLRIELTIVVLMFIGFFTISKYIHEYLIAFIAASLILLVGKVKGEEAITKVDWSVIVFFGGLFILVGTLEEVGVINQIANWLAVVLSKSPIVAAVVLVSVTAGLSAFLDNIPFTVAMAMVLNSIKTVDVGPFWWVLAMGVGIGGNFTFIGSSPNVYVISIIEKLGKMEGTPNKTWFKYTWHVNLVAAVLAVLYAIVVVVFKIK